MITNVSASADGYFGQAESNSDESESVTTNSTVVVMTTIVSLCILISLTVCVILYFQKRRPKTNSQRKSTIVALKHVMEFCCHCQNNGLLKTREEVIAVIVVRTQFVCVYYTSCYIFILDSN